MQACIPGLALRAVILAVVVSMTAFCAYRIWSRNETEPVKIGYIAPDDKLTSLALTYIKHMDALKGWCSLSEMSSLEEGQEVLVLCVACSFFMMEYVNEKNLHQSFFILMYRFTLGYLLVNDLLLLAQMPSVSGMESSTIIYLIGNKFEVTYMHLFFSALYYQVFCTGMKVYLRQYIILVMHLVLTLFIAIGVECSTGVLGVVLLAVFLFLYKKIRFIFRPFFAIILMLLFGAFFLLYETILAIPSVQYLIVDILNEDLTLTGRTYIYTRMLDLMDTQPWFGYGNGTATFFTTYYIHEKLTNTQNGLLNDYIDWGIIGVICLIILTYSVLRSASSRINPFICLIYTYIVLSSIEITLGLRFLAVLPMCMWANKKNN